MPEYATLLVCGQTEKPIATHQSLFAAGRFNDSVIVPLSMAVITSMPSHVRRTQCCEDLEDYLGIDIYTGNATPTGDGFWGHHPFSAGTFVFSVDRKAIEQYLNHITERFPERAPPKVRRW